MNFILDIFILLIFVLTVITSYRRGFVKTVFDFLRGIISLVIACAFSGKLAAWFESRFLEGPIKEKITEKLAELSGNNSIDIAGFIENQRTDFIAFIEKMGISFNDVEKEYGNLESTGAEEMADSIVEYIAQPVITAIATVIAFILLFILSLLLMKFLGWIVGCIFKLPLLNITNKLLGAVLGIVMGFLFSLLFCTLFEFIIPYLGSINNTMFENFNPYEGTIIFKFLCDFELSDYLGRLISY